MKSFQLFLEDAQDAEERRAQSLEVLNARRQFAREKSKDSSVRFKKRSLERQKKIREKQQEILKKVREKEAKVKEKENS